MRYTQSLTSCAEKVDTAGPSVLVTIYASSMRPLMLGRLGSIGLPSSRERS